VLNKSLEPRGGVYLKTNLYFGKPKDLIFIINSFYSEKNEMSVINKNIDKTINTIKPLFNIITK